MTDSSLFRVLECSSEYVTLNPISQKGTRFVDEVDDPVDIDITNIDTSIEQTVSLLDPGHVIKAGVTESDGTHRFTSIEHRGGFTLIELDSRTVPYIIDEYWESEKESTRERFTDDNFVAPLTQIAADSQGELFIQFSSAFDDDSWKEFIQGTESESVYGGFHTMSGEPVEVSIGNPDGEPYWYALLFAKEGSTVARRIRAQYGYLYDDHYIPNPTWDLSELIDAEQVPEDPDMTPKSVFRPEHSVHSNLIPPRFGSDTIELLAELVYVGSQFKMSMLGGSSDDLDLSQPFSHTPVEIASQDPSLIKSYKFYTSLLISIYECVQNNPNKNIQTLVENDTLPDPELLYRAHIFFTSTLHGIESYLEKMEQVPVEEYVVSRIQGGLNPELEKKVDDFNLADLPSTIRYLLHDWGAVLEEFREILKIAPHVADVEETETGLLYNIQAEKKAYDFINTHQDRISDHLIPADLGGEDPGVFMPLLGRLEQRHNWLTTSSISPMGEMFDTLKDDLD